jgi:hypothetical protein
MSPAGVVLQQQEQEQTQDFSGRFFFQQTMAFSLHSAMTERASHI